MGKEVKQIKFHILGLSIMASKKQAKNIILKTPNLCGGFGGSAGSATSAGSVTGSVSRSPIEPIVAPLRWLSLPKPSCSNIFLNLMPPAYR